MGRRLSIPVLVISLLAVPVAQAQEAFIMLWETSDQRLLAGISIATKQISSSAQQTQEMVKNASKASQSAIQQQWQNLEVTRIEERTNYMTGNGIGACSVAQGRTSYVSGATAQEQVMRAVTSADHSWLSSGGDGAQRIGASLAMRKEYFCSSDEDAAGICNRTVNAGAFQAGDSNAGVWMMRRNMGGEEVAVGAMYLDVIAAMPTVVPNARNAEEALALMEARRKGALLSGARASIMNVIISAVGGDAQ